jgi:hypothetical protein
VEKEVGKVIGEKYIGSKKEKISYSHPSFSYPSS